MIGRSCLVAAGAVVTERRNFPDRSLILGSPAKVVRQLSDEEVAYLWDSARHYVERGALFRQQLQQIS